MIRRIVVSAGLLALLFTVSACACGRGTTTGSSATASASSGAAATKGTGTSGSGAMASGDVCAPAPCVRKHDCSACYFSEADMNVGRLNDDLPPGGPCCDCHPRQRHHHETHDPCAPCK